MLLEGGPIAYKNTKGGDIDLYNPSATKKLCSKVQQSMYQAPYEMIAYFDDMIRGLFDGNCVDQVPCQRMSDVEDCIVLNLDPEETDETKKDCIYLGNWDTNPEKFWQEKCLINPAKCEGNGFTTSMWIKYNQTWLMEPGVRFLMGTDYGNHPDPSNNTFERPGDHPTIGWSLWHLTDDTGQNYIRVVVTDVNYMYITEVAIIDSSGIIWPLPDETANNFWTNVGFRWGRATPDNPPTSDDYYIDIYLYGRKCEMITPANEDEDLGCVIIPNSPNMGNMTAAEAGRGSGTYPVFSQAGGGPFSNSTGIYVGCQGDAWGNNKHWFTSAIVDDVAFWAWKLRDEEIPYMLGGKAMPKNNINPDRAKSVTIAPEPINPYYAMADLFYKLYLYDFVPDSNPSYVPNPYIANKTVMPLQSPTGMVNFYFSGRSDPRFSAEGIDPALMSSTFSTQLVNSTSYIYVDRRIVSGNVVNECPHALDNCPEGFSISIWVYLPSTASLRVLNDHYTILRNVHLGTTTAERVNKTFELYTEGNHAFIRIGSRTPVQFPGDCTPMLGRWTNLGFSFHPVLGIKTFVNGLEKAFVPLYDQITAPTQLGAPAVTPDISHPSSSAFMENDLILGSDGFLSSSLAGMALNDLAIWKTYIYPFETYKFLGMSEKEAVLVWNATWMWTADYDTNRDRALYWNKLGGMWLYPDTGYININIKDTDVKGKTIMTTNTTNGFLGLRDPITNAIFLDQDSNCFANPGICDQSGATYGGFFRVNQSITHPGRHFIVSTGNIDNHCIGVALWFEIDSSVVPNRVLFAEVSRYSDYNVNNGKTANYAVWRISVPVTEVEGYKWFHYSITWSLEAGLYLFINGVVKGWASRANIVGVDSIVDAKPKWRYDNRVLLGIDNFYNGIMKDTGYVSYESLGVYHKMVAPLEVPKLFNLIENPWYGTATHWFGPRQFISNWQHPLYNMRKAAAIGVVAPQFTTPHAIGLAPKSAVFNKPQSMAPIFLKNSTDWAENMTIAMWVKINSKDPGQVIYATDKYFGGFGGMHLITNANGLYAPACSSVPPNDATNTIAPWSKILGKWINVAISYNKNGGVITCWVNGVLTTAKYQNPAPLTGSTELTAVVTVGGIDMGITGATGQQDFEIYQLAVYTRAMSNIAELGLMMGMPQQEAIYLITGDYYWSFSGPAHDLFVPGGKLVLPQGAEYDIDSRIQGYDVRTSSGSKSCINLGNFAGTCLTNVSMCASQGIVFSSWIKLLNLSSEGYIFSTGGQQPGEPGVFIGLGKNGVLTVGVSNGTYLWSRSRIYIATTDLWFNLMFRWNISLGLEVYVNGQLQTDDVAIGSAAPIRNALFMFLFTNATVGCSNSDMSKAVPVEVDDIWFRANYSITPLSTDDCPTSANYRNIFYRQMMDSTGTIAPYNAFKKSWATPVYSITYPADWKTGDEMDMDKQCPGDLSKCPNGFTVSFWFMLPSLKQFSRSLLNLRSSQFQGIQFYLDNQNLQQSLRVEMHNETHRWLITVADYVDVNKWLQLVAAWDTRRLTVYTLQRQYAPVNAQKSPGTNPDWTATYSAGVTLDSGIWQYYMEDLNIWYTYLENLRAYPMGISCVHTYTDFVPDEMPTPPVLASSLTVAGVCYLMSDDGKDCLLTKEQWDRGAVQHLSSQDYFKVLTMLQGKGTGSTDVDDLGIAKYQPQAKVQDVLSMKKQILNGAIMTLTDRTKYGLALTTYDYVQLCSSVLYPIESRESWIALSQQGDSAMSVADALEIFGGKVIENLEPYEMDINDTINLNNSIDIHADNIIFTAEVLPTPKPGQNGTFINNYEFPNYERCKMQSVSFNKKWKAEDTFDKIIIPPNALNNLDCEDADGVNLCAGGTRPKVTVVASLYDTMGHLVPPKIDSKSDVYRADVKEEDVEMISRVISITVKPKIKDDASNNIKITMKHYKQMPDKKMAICAFYTADRTWDTTGCKVENYTATETTCICNHLTNFAILMQPVPVENEPIHDLVLSILTYVGLIISMLALASLFYLFVSKSKLHCERNTIHINLVIALFLANTFFLFTGPAQYFKTLCQACAGLMHYFYTATFMWLLMECTHLFNAVVSGVFKGRLCCMLPLAWGVPVLVVAGVLAVDPEAYGSDSRCWLSFDRGFIFAFIGPIILIVILNAILLGLIVYNLPNTVLKRDTRFYNNMMRGIRHTAVILPLFGVTWLFGLFAVNENLVVFQYLFVIFNSLQGFFIFLAFGWFQPDVKRYMCSRDDDDDDEDDPHKDVVNSESDLKTIVS